MARHASTMEATRPRVTQRRGSTLREREASIFTRWPAIVASSQELVRRITGPNPSRLVPCPGVPSLSRLSHWRNDETNPFTAVAALVYALAIVGDGRETAELITLRVSEWIDEAFADAPRVALEDALRDIAEMDCREHEARFAVAMGGLSTEALVEYRDRLRDKLVMSRSALVEVNRALAERRV